MSKASALQEIDELITRYENMANESARIAVEEYDPAHLENFLEHRSDFRAYSSRVAGLTEARKITFSHITASE
ncbi:MAG: hypothetical protein KAS32_01805 [Candidatus Peribacteraceae bacterium]|nr:hypothetical protein [Candidatus Peribacteraceae bacterium]